MEVRNLFWLVKAKRKPALRTVPSGSGERVGTPQQGRPAEGDNQTSLLLRLGSFGGVLSACRGAQTPHRWASPTRPPLRGGPPGRWRRPTGRGGPLSRDR